MATQGQSFGQPPRVPLTKADLNDDTNYLPIPDDTLQLQVDMLNVVENRVPLDSFPPDYQTQIINYYRFSAFRQNTTGYKPANVTDDTLDIV